MISECSLMKVKRQEEALTSFVFYDSYCTNTAHEQ